jgi:hypothetical protein
MCGTTSGTAILPGAVWQCSLCCESTEGRLACWLLLRLPPRVCVMTLRLRLRLRRQWRLRLQRQWRLSR